MAKNATKKQYSATSIAGVFVSQRIPMDQLPSHIEGHPIVAYAVDAENEHVLYFATRALEEGVEPVLKWVAIE